MEYIKNKAYKALRWSEKYAKTDMVYVAHGSFWVGIGQVSSAIITLASSIFFANLISKDLYGNYKFIVAATSILGAFTLSGMGTIVTQGVAQGFEGILKNAVKTTLKWGSIIVSIAFATSFYYFINGNNTLGFTMLIAGISLPINQAYSLFGSYLVGKKEWKKGTLYNIGSQFINTVALIVTAITTQSVLAMVFVYFTINTFTTILGYLYTLKIFHINDRHDHTLIPYGKHLSLMGLLGTIANQFDKILIFHYLGAMQLAIYAFAQAVPDQLKGLLKSIFGIALPKYAALEESELKPSIIKKSIQLTIITALTVAILILVIPFLFKFIFPKYLESVFYSQIYLLGLITVPGITLFGIYFQLKKATRTLYKLNVMGNTATLIITFILIYKYGLLGAVIANGASWFVMLLVNGFYFFKDKSLVPEQTVA
jgi:O-antigen/teichoic acid export membrane protein